MLNEPVAHLTFHLKTISDTNCYLYKKIKNKKKSGFFDFFGLKKKQTKKPKKNKFFHP
jgi:hypothetical protein